MKEGAIYKMIMVELKHFDVSNAINYFVIYGNLYLIIFKMVRR